VREKSSSLQMANSVLRFLLELAALTILGIWGWQVVGGQPQRLVLAIAAPVLPATAWGLFVAPRAARFLPLPGRLALEALVFGSATLALADLGRPTPADVFAVLAVMNTALVHLWQQDVQAHRSVTKPDDAR
jgi:hypothetical protein